MRTKDPARDYPHRVVVMRSNTDAFHGRRATPALLSWMKEHVGPVGVLWKARRCPEGYELLFIKDDHAFLTAMRWGGT